MGRIANTKEEIRSLFAKTGNQCAFPECDHPLILEGDKFVAQVCHIEAAESGGPRYNAAMTDEERKSTDNLIVLCYMHHKITDDVEEYTVEIMKKIKEDHEKFVVDRIFDPPDFVVEKIVMEQEAFERDVLQKNEEWREEFDLAMEAVLSKNPLYHLQEMRNSIGRIEDLVDELHKFLSSLSEDIAIFLQEIGYDITDYKKIPYYENPFSSPFWEMLNIGMPNFHAAVHFHSKALQLHIEFQKLQSSPDDTSIRKSVDMLKEELSEMASTLAHVD